MSSQRPSRHDATLGAVKFVLVHHDGCPRENFHFRISQDGSIENLLNTDRRGQHPNSLGIVVSGNFDELPPSSTQIEALKNLLIDLKLRFPSFALGAHRQVRGDAKTTCPGAKFPMKELSSWAAHDLVQIRDDRIRHDIESQYEP